MIRLEGLSVGPLRDISLNLMPGRLYGVIGPSGSGKTAFLHCLAGLLPPSAGQVSFEGMTLYEDPVRDQHHRNQVAVVFDQPAMIPDRSALDNVRLPMDLRGVDLVAGEARARQLMASVGLEGAEGKKPGELSGGMLTRLQVARALAVDPAVFVFDGPTAGLDPVSAARLLGTLRTTVNEQQATGFVSTQDVRAAIAFCDGLLLLNGSMLRGPLAPTMSGDVSAFVSGRRPW
jgi:ABC-type multidrug transport system ATPase subunit